MVKAPQTGIVRETSVTVPYDAPGGHLSVDEGTTRKLRCTHSLVVMRANAWADTSCSRMQHGSGRSSGVLHRNTSCRMYSKAAASRLLGLFDAKSTFHVKRRKVEGSGSLMPLAQLDVCAQRFLCSEKRTARSGRGISSMFDLPLMGSGSGCCVSEEDPSSSEGGEGIKGSSLSESNMVGMWVGRGCGSIYAGHAVFP